MANTTYAKASRDTINTGYKRVFLDDRTTYFAWFLKTEEYPDQVYTVTLDSVDYDIRLRWNTRDESWQVILGLSGEDPSITFKAVNGLDLLKPYKYKESVPNGELYMVDTVKINGRPGFTTTGDEKRFSLVYIDSLPYQA